jgi:ATP-dependent helicase/nuclease subunit A
MRRACWRAGQHGHGRGAGAGEYDGFRAAHHRASDEGACCGCRSSRAPPATPLRHLPATDGLARQPRRRRACCPRSTWSRSSAGRPRSGSRRIADGTPPRHHGAGAPQARPAVRAGGRTARCAHSRAAAREDRAAEAPEVQDLVALLDALVSPTHDLSLARALKSPVFGIDDEALAQLARKRRARGTPRPWLVCAGQRRSLPPVLAEAGEKLKRWQQLVHDAAAARRAGRHLPRRRRARALRRRRARRRCARARWPTCAALLARRCSWGRAVRHALRVRARAARGGVRAPERGRADAVRNC